MKKIPNSNFIYFPDKILGKGSFSNVHLGVNLLNKKKVAVKIENKEIGTNTIFVEYVFYSEIVKNKNYSKFFIPKFYGYFTDEKKNYLVIELLEYTLSGIMKKINHNFDDYSVKNIFFKMIKSLEFIHSYGFLHRDIKPENILLDRRLKKIYLIDFGLSKKYINSDNHISIKLNVNPCGTIRFMSKYANNLVESSRRDDLISLGYSMIFILKGSLPWQNLNIQNKKEKYKKIGELKNSITIKELCSDCPNYFTDFFNHCYNLKFKEKPDYNFLLSLFYK